MIRPGFDQGAALERFRGIYRNARPPFVVVPSLLAPDVAEALRQRVAAAPFQSFYLADRGRYRLNEEHREESLVDGLRRFAELITGASLAPGGARWLVLRRGDYSLIRDDAVRRRAQPPRHLELTLDFSDEATNEAEVVYSDGRESWVVPQYPSSLALIERHEGIFRYDRYLTHQVGELEVHRLRLALMFVDVAPQRA